MDLCFNFLSSAGLEACLSPSKNNRIMQLMLRMPKEAQVRILPSHLPQEETIRRVQMKKEEETSQLSLSWILWLLKRKQCRGIKKKKFLREIKKSRNGWWAQVKVMQPLDQVQAVLKIKRPSKNRAWEANSASLPSPWWQLFGRGRWGLDV